MINREVGKLLNSPPHPEPREWPGRGVCAMNSQSAKRLRRASELLQMQAVHDRLNHVAHRIAPLMPSRAADKVTGRVVYASLHLALATLALHGDVKIELPK